MEEHQTINGVIITPGIEKCLASFQTDNTLHNEFITNVVYSNKGLDYHIKLVDEIIICLAKELTEDTDRETEKVEAIRAAVILRYTFEDFKLPADLNISQTITKASE